MGEDPPEEPPDNPTIEVLGGDEDNEEDDIAVPEAKKQDDIAVPEAKKQDDIAVSDDDKEEDEDLSIIKGIPDHCYDRTPFDEKTLYPDEWQDCYDSDGNYDPVLTDFVNNDYPEDVYYQGGKLHKMKKKKASPPTKTPTSTEVNHCQFCFLSGQPIKVTVSHNDMDIDCPSMSDVDRRRIHGDKETDRWLARMHGYND